MTEVFSASSGARLVALYVVSAFAFFLGWGIRSCGGRAEMLVAYAFLGPIIYHRLVVLGLGLFVIGSFVRFPASRSVMKTLFLTAVILGLVLGYALMSPGGCRVDV
jgi:hypothetical protein